MAENWTTDELNAAVKTYMQMLTKQKNNVAYNKSEYRNTLQNGILKNRTRPSIEYRMQNISHVLNTIGLEYIDGYKPAKNVGTNTFEIILSALERNKHINPKDFEPTPDPETLIKRTERIRKKINLKFRPKGDLSPQKEQITSFIYYRDPAVRAWVLENAKGICESCGSEAPFLLSNGDPFLEVHHVIPLAEQGPDTVDNAIAVCPNCHRRFHLSKNKTVITDKIYETIKRLNKY